MKKIKTIKYPKLWGYEIWLHSAIKDKETTLEDGTIINNGPLVKIIQANKPLSVQVHPDDKFAKELENENNGKSESWYILDHKKGSSIIMGLKNYNKKIIRAKLKNKTFEDNLILIKVKNNNFYNIPAGLVHGIGAGNTILEVQQSSDITYRYYDYNRLENGKLRELHINKAIKVQKNLDWNLKPISTNPLTYKNKLGIQIFMKKPIIIQKKAIIVNLETYNSYLADKNEYIDFNYYAIISL